MAIGCECNSLVQFLKPPYNVIHKTAGLMVSGRSMTLPGTIPESFYSLIHKATIVSGIFMDQHVNI